MGLDDSDYGMRSRLPVRPASSAVSNIWRLLSVQLRRAEIQGSYGVAAADCMFDSSRQRRLPDYGACGAARGSCGACGPCFRSPPASSAVSNIWLL
ncbi:unnamed protein product [Gadus morhua 'NCC']